MESTTKALTLASVISDLLSQPREWSIDALIGEVDKRTPDDLIRDFYRAALRTYLRNRLSNESGLIRMQETQAQRRSATVSTVTFTPPPPPQAAQSRRRSPAPATPPRPSVQTLASSRTALFRLGFRAQILVAPNTYKSILACTADELKRVALVNRELAAANLIAAERYEALAEIMESRGVATVGELAESDVESLAAA